MINIIIITLKCNSIITLEVLVAVELVRKSQVKQKVFSQDLKTCQRGAFENCLS